MVLCNTMIEDNKITEKLWWRRLENLDHQTTLYWGDGELHSHKVIPLSLNKDILEKEKNRFIEIMSEFIDKVNMDTLQEYGRPKFNLRDIIKSLLIMSYHSFSYRRAKSDLNLIKELGLIHRVPPRSTLNDYANKEYIKRLIEKLIQYSSLFFIENESTLILDSTWLGLRMYSGGYRKVYNKELASLQKVRKLHIACLKNSKIIAVAKTTKGTVNDSIMFEELVKTSVKNGFNISKLLADAGYTSKNNYLLCKELGILNAFIDFRKNATTKRAKSDLWRERVKMWKEQKELWHESYRFRVLIEGVFSSIKRKNINYLRARKETSQDVELLLKVLVYNLTIIGKYS